MFFKKRKKKIIPMDVFEIHQAQVHKNIVFGTYQEYGTNKNIHVIDLPFTAKEAMEQMQKDAWATLQNYKRLASEQFKRYLQTKNLVTQYWKTQDHEDLSKKLQPEKFRWIYYANKVKYCKKYYKALQHAYCKDCIKK